MKVATKESPDDQPNRDVLVFNSDQTPALFSDAYIEGNVAKIKNLSFVIHPQKQDFIFDIRNDTRSRKAAGCIFLIGEDVFLAADLGNARGEGTYFINIKTGEGWRSLNIGSPQRNLIRDAVAVPCWRIVETTGDKIPWISYTVPVEQQTTRVA